MIPFNRPSLTGSEQAYMMEAFAAHHISGDGVFTWRCHRLLEEVTGSHKALLTTSCTHALEMTALLLDLQPGDEVIMPSFTFVSCANAFVLRGARPVFCDIRPDTLNIDPDCIRRVITPRTKAILVVHYAGVGCAMDEISDIALQHNIALIEDNAHGLFGSYRGKALGSFGSMATLSFHETKNVTCGEGGALLINDPEFSNRAEIIREKGTNRSQFFRGQVDKYTWVDIGSSFLPSDILAGLLLAQLEERDAIQTKRRAIWERYDSELRAWASAHDIGQPVVPVECEQAYHLYYLLFPSLELRQSFIAEMKAAGVQTVFHYLPLNRSEMARTIGAESSCPVTESISDRLVRLPFFTDLTQAMQSAVIDAVLHYQF